ncbi:aminoacyl-tRNA hydrolase [Microlunatus parietis]|uniref:peptidyl-tRNA hydrolase n=1 Tax=Microlunatus parietis TaxID=682979 RepID=A0A7Y9IEQ2_9ACTN|nr:aminoacyl-tRNA hydrolase [Microlunatus parietis]NYE75474.1 peptidyl-tRNA hydrolase [Microlunatus parietis]
MVIGQALEPLRRRYLHWLGLSGEEIIDDRDEAAEDIRAMQLVLRLERTAEPSWHAAAGLAATAAARLCLDPRAEPGGPWAEAIAAYCAGHIRKVTRRARGAHWAALADLPGIALADGDTEVIALLPGRIAELDKRVARLQVGGTDLPVDDAPDLGPSTGSGHGVLRLWLPPEPVMSLGKTMAQTGHAGMIAAALLAADDPDTLTAWADQGCPATARRVGAADWQQLSERLADAGEAWQDQRLLAVRDAGFTEIAPGTITVIAQLADESQISSADSREPGGGE